MTNIAVKTAPLQYKGNAYYWFDTDSTECTFCDNWCDNCKSIYLFHLPVNDPILNLVKSLNKSKMVCCNQCKNELMKNPELFFTKVTLGLL
ncbi:MAG: hypothetical protein CMC55_08680 [Flavobacteriaceae bacterium]|nr:hypothetical protein [Flavobacteriaceae bacterium]|tara:strand:+ start:1046 stop:1318 length:273 start_codon:yes stop_codon:yes gene_type:complete